VKPTFEDIPNSNDTRVVFQEFSYGGTYDLAVIRLDSARDTNRDDVSLPERVDAFDKDPNKRKR
jgi:hypothetical protein